MKTRTFKQASWQWQLKRQSKPYKECLRTRNKSWNTQKREQKKSFKIVNLIKKKTFWKYRDCKRR